ncbi:MAG TPA: hypothetical protein VFT86_09695, partial [Gaiellaceae bacterium]|nr:hypothetical protein [Gaiellaceae bacterium]
MSIGSGCTVTIDTAAAALSLIVFNGGVLQYEETTARTLVVGDYVTVAVGGIFQSAATGTQTGHVLSVAGSLTNAGTMDFSTNADTAGAGIVFTGAANTSLVNSGSLDLRQTNGINLNKGTSAVSMLDFSPGGTITVQGANTAGFLTIANGTFRIVGSNTFSNPVFASATYTIPVTGAFWLNAPNVTVVGQAGSPTNNGLLRVSDGTLNVGTLGTHVMGAGVGAMFNVDGGILNLAGRLNSSNAFINYTQSAGQVNVCVAGGCATSPSFGFTGTSVVMKMSGGSINLVNSNGLTTADYNMAGTMVYTGGVLNIGTAATATNFTFRAQGQAPSVVVDNTTNNKNLVLSGQLNVWGTTTIKPGTTVNLTSSATVGQTLLQIGPTVVNNGAIVVSGNNLGTLNFAGSLQALNGGYEQNYTGTGTFGAVGLRPATLSVQNAPGVTLDPAVSPLNVYRANLFYGELSNSNLVTIGNGDALLTVVQRGATGIAFAAGNFDSSPTYNLGTSAYTLVYAQSQGSVATGPEIPASRTVASIQILNPTGVTLAGGDLTSTGAANALLLSVGTLNTSSSNKLIVTGTAAGSVTGGSAATWVNGPLVRTLPANLASGTYTFPVGKGSFKMLELVNPTTNAGGTVTIEAEAFDADSGGTGGAGFDDINHNRYWSAQITGGAANFTNATVRLTEQGTATANAIGQSATQGGTYDSIGGLVTGATIGPSNTITSLGYFAVGHLTTGSTISGVFNVGAGGDYATLTAAVADLNSKRMTGPVTFVLTDNTYAAETYPITINANGGNSALNTLTIKPTAGASPTFSGSSASALLVLNGIDYVTIDGSNSGGSTRDTTFTNTNVGTASAVIWGQTVGTANPTTNNTIKNLNVVGNASTTTFAGIGFGSSTIGTGTLGTRNDNNRVQNNNVTQLQFGIVSVGSQSAAKNTGTVVTGNTLGANGAGALGRAGVWIAFDDGAQVTGNTVVNVTAANSADVFGLAIGTIAVTGTAITTQDVANVSVTGNFVGSVVKTDTFSAAGIALGTPNYGTSRIANNSVYGVNANSTPGDLAAGIIVGSAGTLYATTEIYFNSVSMTGARDGGATLTSTGSYALAVVGANPLLNVRNNALYNTQTATNGGAGNTAGSYAIGLSAIGLYNFLTSNYNDLYTSGPSSHFSAVGAIGTATVAQVPFFDRPTFAAWKAETGKDANSINVDPMFGSATNLRPLPGSPLLGAGQTIAGITTDIVGDPRADPPTIGAYENPSLPPPPANDDFGDADVLTELQSAGGTRSGDNTYATVQTGEPPHAGAGPFKSVWYKFTPVSSRRIRFDTCNAGFDTVLAAYTGPSVDNLTPVSSNDDFCGSGGTRSR